MALAAAVAAVMKINRVVEIEEVLVRMVIYYQ